MGDTEPSAAYPATSDEVTAALNDALEAGDLNRIMGTVGEMTRASLDAKSGPGNVAGQGNPASPCRPGPALSPTPP